jgi:hypothetical protein
VPGSLQPSELAGLLEAHAQCGICLPAAFEGWAVKAVRQVARVRQIALGGIHAAFRKHENSFMLPGANSPSHWNGIPAGLLKK